MFLFLALPRIGKALVDDCGLALQTRWRENAPKREKIQFPVAVRGSKTSVLNFPNIVVFCALNSIGCFKARKVFFFLLSMLKQ